MTTPTISSNTPDVANDWTFTATAGSQHSCTFTSVASCGSSFRPGAGWGGLPAAEGFVYGTLMAQAVIRQQLTGLAAGASYTIGFRLNAQPGTGTQPANIPFPGARWVVSGDGNDINVNVNGLIFTQASVPYSFPTWSNITTNSFTATSATALLVFYTTNPSGGALPTSFADWPSAGCLRIPRRLLRLTFASSPWRPLPILCRREPDDLH